MPRGRKKTAQVPRQPLQTTYYYPSVARPSIIDMQPHELIEWLHSMIAWEEAKRQREKRYLDHRAARGTHTPTDDAYEADQVKHDDLIRALKEMLEETEKHL